MSRGTPHPLRTTITDHLGDNAFPHRAESSSTAERFVSSYMALMSITSGNLAYTLTLLTTFSETSWGGTRQMCQVGLESSVKDHPIESLVHGRTVSSNWAYGP